MATATLAEPEIVSCQFERSFQPPLLAMKLDWRGKPLGRRPRLWTLPGGLQVIGPAPVQFGIEVLRHGSDSYAVRLLWNENSLSWIGLRRQQLLHTSLADLLAILGTDLIYLLDQPIIQPEAPQRN